MPQLHVDTEIIGRNTEVVARLLRACGLDLVGVTKGCLGEPRVGAAMLAGGAVALADTRDYNLRRLRAGLPRAELHRIYLPPVGQRFALGDVTYVSSVSGAAAVAAAPETDSTALSTEARPSQSGSLPAGWEGPRRVMLSVETGDEREGVPAEQAVEVATAIADDARLYLAGVSTNYACFRGTPENILGSVEALCRVAGKIRAAGFQVERVSGGNSSLLALLAEGIDLPSAITEVRCGEALLLGHEALSYRPLSGCVSACLLRAEVLEEYTKPSAGKGRSRLVLALGRQDLGEGQVSFTYPGLQEMGRSGDYLVVEIDAGHHSLRPGSTVDMVPSYEALVAAWTSPYVELRLL